MTIAWPWAGARPLRQRVSARAVAGAGAALLVALGAMLTGAVAWTSIHAPVVFWSSVQVRFLAPTSTANPNNLQLSIGSIVMTANAVRTMIDDSDAAQPSSPDVRIVDEGIVNGWAVTLPNSGGQYQDFYVDPYLIVQASGPDPVTVRHRIDRLLDRIDRDLATLQANAHVSPFVAVRTARSVGTPQVVGVYGSRARALAGCLILGFAGTTVAVKLYLTVLRRRAAARALRSG